jgi:hypothetical protein
MGKDWQAGESGDLVADGSSCWPYLVWEVVVVEAQFSGLRRWQFDSDIIECEDTELGFVDMHNDSNVDGFEVAFSSEGPVLRVKFLHIAKRRSYVIEFAQIDSFQVMQQLEAGSDFDLLIGVDYVASEIDDLPNFEVDMGQMKLSFKAAIVRFEALR